LKIKFKKNKSDKKNSKSGKPANQVNPHIIWDKIIEGNKVADV